MKQWFAVHTQARGEAQARFNLMRQSFEVYLPRYLKRRRHARRTDWVGTPLFSRYLFVQIDINATPWHTIRSTFGVSHLVCNGAQPAPIPNALIDEIRAREDEAGMVAMGDAQPPFNKGQVVKVTSGPLAEQVGWFETVSDDERVILLLDLLGRRIQVRVPTEAVAAFA